MALDTDIEWARHPITHKGATWNIITGCQIVSPGCTNCYAMKLAGNRLRNIDSRKGLTIQTKAGPVWNGKIRFNEQWLTQPLKWTKPRGIFVCAHGDLFADGVTADMLDKIFAVMALCPQHVFYVLTKRPERMRDYLSNPTTYQRILRAADPLRAQRPRLCGLPISDTRAGGFWPHVWMGTSVEDQQWADTRRPPMEDLARLHWTTFISYEPALGPVDWTGWEFLKWMISGGESGSRARPHHPDWHRAARDFCARWDIAYFFKQWGNWGLEEGEIGSHVPYAIANDGTLYKMTDLAYPDGPRYGEAIRANHNQAHMTAIYKVGKKEAGRMLDGIEHNAFPEVSA